MKLREVLRRIVHGGNGVVGHLSVPTAGDVAVSEGGL